MPRISRSRTSARMKKCFSPCVPVSTNEPLRSALVAIRRLGGSFFWSSNTVASVAPGSRMRNVSIWNWPCADCQRVPLRMRLSWVASLAGSPSCAPVARSSTMRQPTRSRRFFADVASASRSPSVSTPVSRKPRSFWNAFTAADRAVAELAVRRPGIVVGPVEVELDRGALRDRHAGIRARRRPRFLRALLAGVLLRWRGLFLLLREADRLVGLRLKRQWATPAAWPPMRRSIR